MRSTVDSGVLDESVCAVHASCLEPKSSLYLWRFSSLSLSVNAFEVLPYMHIITQSCCTLISVWDFRYTVQMAEIGSLNKPQGCCNNLARL